MSIEAILDVDPAESVASYTCSFELVLRRVSLALFTPFDWSSEAVLRACIADLKAGKCGNCNSELLELIRRVGTVVVGVVFSLVTVPLALLSRGLDYATQKIFKK